MSSSNAKAQLRMKPLALEKALSLIELLHDFLQHIYFLMLNIEFTATYSYWVRLLQLRF